MQYQIEIADPKEKESKVNALVQLYNQYDKYFPNNKNGNYEKRAIALYTYKVGTPEDLYSYLNQAFEKEKETFSNSEALYTYFEMYFAKYKELPTNWAWQNAVGITLLTSAMKKANSADGKKIADALRGLTVDSPFGANGKITMRAEDQTIVEYADGWGELTNKEPYMPNPVPGSRCFPSVQPRSPRCHQILSQTILTRFRLVHRCRFRPRSGRFGCLVR